MKKTLLLLLCCLILQNNAKSQSNSNEYPDLTSIPIVGNTYITAGETNKNLINENGISEWNDAANRFSSWFKVSNSGFLSLSIRAKIEEGESKIKITANNTPFQINIKNSTWAIIPIGQINIDNAGYIQVDFEALEKTGKTYGEVSDIIISGSSAKSPLFFVKEFSTYWGQRGPSVHLKYQLPENENIEYFYNEVTVPKGEDVIGSYYMSNGFDGGYFGIQVNR